MHISLPHGDVRLPAFFPDGTYGSVKCLDKHDLHASGVRGLVMNTFHLLTRPGVGTLRAIGGLHALSNWDRPILTDSGGFQAFSLIRENPQNGEIRNNEILFRNEVGERISLSPEKCIQAQMTYGSDIVMCLDVCTHPDDDYATTLRSVELTIKWAKVCKEQFETLVKQKKFTGAKRPKLFGIIQGGADKQLRKQCAQELIALGLDGFGYGGWPLDGEGNLTGDILEYTANLMPDDLPKYAMGMGRPEEIVALYRMGYTLFDCVIPTREARHHRLYVFDDGPLNEANKGFYQYFYYLDDTHARDTRPVDASCDCHLCQNYSRAYLRHLAKAGDPLALRLASMHNVRFYTRLMERLQDGC